MREMDMGYRFHGWETATVPPVTDFYPDIKNPRDLYDALNRIWCKYTCAPHLRDQWSESNKTLGACSVTAFVAQDIFVERYRGYYALAETITVSMWLVIVCLTLPVSSSMMKCWTMMVVRNNPGNSISQKKRSGCVMSI